MNSYFYRLPRLWNSLPIIDLSCSLAVIKFKLKAYFWDYFVTILIVIFYVLIITFVHVVNALRLLPLLTLIAYNVTVYLYFCYIFLL